MGEAAVIKTITLLGSTGSIGTQTLESCRSLGIGVHALAANRQTKLLEAQAREFLPEYVVVSDRAAYDDLKIKLADTPVRLLFGIDGMCEVAAAPQADLLCNAVVGMVGLRPTLAALEAGKSVALSNKETLVAAGELVTGLARKKGVSILPVDSEHSAIFQCLQGSGENKPEKIILTASGGPFRGKTKAELAKVTLEDALKHPNWSMGAKITVDSSTLMNKGLELIEAMWLFGLPPKQIEIIVHPQSIIHSAIEYEDGAVIAQLGAPDMLLPIQYALTYPARHTCGAPRLSLTDCATLTFEKPDLDTFDCLRHCITAAERGGLHPCAVNSANEQAVALFLAGKISYLKIGECVAKALEKARYFTDEYTLEQVLETDRTARAQVLEYCGIQAE